MAGAGQACVTLGALAALIGVIMGVVFMTNEEFVVATFQCNPDAVDAQSTSAICTENRVTINGEVCQVGNLGLYTASFTPDCLDGTPFAIPDIIADGTFETTEFPVLFPAQTKLSGAAAALPPFESCSSFFASPFTQGALESIAVGAAVGSFQDELFGLPAALKATYDAQFTTVFAGLDFLFSQSAAGIVASISGGLSGLVGPIPADITTPYNGYPNVIAGLQNLTAIPSAQVLASGLSAGLASAGSETATAEVLKYGLTFGTSDAGSKLESLPSVGLYGATGPILCNVMTGSSTGCIYLDWIIFQNATNPDPSSRAQIEPVTELLLGLFETNIIPFFYPGNSDRTDFQALTASSGFDKARQLEIMQLTINASQIVPDNWLLPANANGGGPFYGVLCGALGPFCTFADFLEATFQGLVAANQTEDVAALQQARDIVFACGAANATGAISVDGSETQCVDQVLRSPLIGPGSGIGLSQSRGAFAQVLGNFYGAIDTTDPALADPTAALAAAEAQCVLDEQDKAAIAQAQVLFPAGVALSGVGLFVAILNLALFAGSGMSKYVGLFAGLLSIVGLVLAVVALFGVYSAPIYQSLGAGEGPVPDGEQLFSSGIGFIYVLVSLAGAALGAVLITLGAIFLKTEDPAVDIMKA